MNVRIFVYLILLAGTACFFGCSGMPSGEQQNKEALQQYEKDKKAEEFARSLPPAR